MIAIRSLEDLEQAPLSPGVRRAARDAIANPADNEALRHVMGCSLLEATLEGVSYDRECGCFVAVAQSFQ